MEHLRSIASKYYFASSEQTRKKVDEFIDALDKDRNGKVDYYEFKVSLREQGYGKYANSDMFKKLDRNGDQGLEFSELIALYYIIMTGRPFCGWCDAFITAEYFVCKECFETSNAPFYLCPSCYETGKSKSHDKNALFLDTYAMLESQRLAALRKKQEHLLHSSSSSSSSSLAIVPSNTGGPTGKMLLMKAVDVALTLVGYACNIM